MGLQVDRKVITDHRVSSFNSISYIKLDCPVMFSNWRCKSRISHTHSHHSNSNHLVLLLWIRSHSDLMPDVHPIGQQNELLRRASRPRAVCCFNKGSALNMVLERRVAFAVSAAHRSQPPRRLRIIKRSDKARVAGEQSTKGS